MSWGGGTDIMGDMIRSFNKHEICVSLRRDLYVDLIKSLQGEDWGNPDECLGQDLAFDWALEVVRRRWCESHGHDYDERYGGRS
jgi:hypothetical protein